MTVLKPLDTLKTQRECALKLLEEASEACEAMKRHEKVCALMTDEPLVAARVSIEADSIRTSALRELADVLQVVTNCLFALRATKSEVDGAIDHVQDGNRNRGRHEVDGANALTVDWGAHD